VIRPLIAAVFGVIIGSVGAYLELIFVSGDWDSPPDSHLPIRLAVLAATPFVTGALFGLTAYRLTSKR
jgi:hypothetical protein